MPTVIHMLVEVSVPVPDKDAIAQMVVTQALVAAAEAVREVVKGRDGVCTIDATVKRVAKAVDPDVIMRGDASGIRAVDPGRGPLVGDTPETMPVALP